jgi:hypothetical protein
MVGASGPTLSLPTAVEWPSDVEPSLPISKIFEFLSASGSTWKPGSEERQMI